MSNTQLTPYPELKLAWMADESEFSLSTPWLSLQVAVEREERAPIRALTKEGFHPSFLEFFSNYPISFLKRPTPPDNELPPAGKLARSIASSAGPRELVRAASSQSLSEGWINTLPTQWNWSTAEADTSDPLELYSRLRRLRLLDESQDPNNKGLYAALEASLLRNEESFFNACRLTLRQTYHITAQCVPSLRPALNAEGYAPGAIEQFIREEKGHDRLVLRSLQALGVSSPEPIPLFEETRLSMDLLKLAAGHMPLAFSCIVGAYEGNNYSEHDPIGGLLQRSSRPEAAQGIEKHYRINLEGRHALVGEKLAAGLGSAQSVHALGALRVCEAVTWLGNALSRRLVEAMA